MGVRQQRLGGVSASAQLDTGKPTRRASTGCLRLLTDHLPIRHHGAVRTTANGHERLETDALVACTHCPTAFATEGHSQDLGEDASR